MAKNQPPKRLFKAPDKASRFVVDRSSKARLKSISREYEDVLKAIETVIVKAGSAMPQFDDNLADLALTAALHGAEPDEPVVKSVADAITWARPRDAEITDVIWKECLRVVIESVRRHSDRRPGRITYLEFAGGYIK